MKTAELVRVIEQEGQPLAGGMVGELRTNLGTSYYRRHKEAEVLQRIQAVYQTLGSWLAARDDSRLRGLGEELGQRRFQEGIPLGQLVLALILNEKHLWNYLGSRAAQADEEALKLVTEFFQKMIYHTARGYEVALAQSNRFAQQAEVPKTPEAAAQTPAEPGSTEAEMPISRGGQVGEFGG